MIAGCATRSTGLWEEWRGDWTSQNVHPEYPSYQDVKIIFRNHSCESVQSLQRKTFKIFGVGLFISVLFQRPTSIHVWWSFLHFADKPFSLFYINILKIYINIFKKDILKSKLNMYQLLILMFLSVIFM